MHTLKSAPRLFVKIVFGHKDTLFSLKNIRFKGKKYLKKIPSACFGWDFCILVLIIYSLHTITDGGKHLVWNGVEDVAEGLHWQMLSEDFHGIALLAVDARYIYHRHIHADVAHIVCLLSVYQTVSMAIAKMAVQAVGIADRDGCDDAVLIENGFSAIAHTLSCLDMVHLEDRGLQGAHAVDGLIVARVDTVESQAQATHIQLALREVLDTCRVADMRNILWSKAA